jgi:serine/threonine protein kinase
MFRCKETDAIAMPKDKYPHLDGFDVLEEVKLPNSTIGLRARCTASGVLGDISVGDIVILSEWYADDGKVGDKQASGLIDALASLSHPNIVRMYGILGWKGEAWRQHAYFVKEYFEGIDLEKWVDREHPAGVPFDEASPILRSLLSACEYLSAQGVWHGSINSKSVLFSKAAMVKLDNLNLGNEEEPSETAATAAGWIAPDHYAAPERLTMLGFAGDETSEVFSLAVVFYRILTGKQPFRRKDGKGPDSYANRCMNPSEYRISYSHPVFDILTGLRHFFEKALAHEREDRLKTFREFSQLFWQVEKRIIRSDLGKLEFVELVGKGGFGKVYKTKNLQDGSWLAVKELSKMQHIARFRREGRTLQRIASRNVVKCYQLVEEPATHCAYLVMEYLDGMPGASLKDRIRGDHLMDVEETLILFSSFAEGLNDLHNAGIFHRDIKPANLYAPHGKPTQGKIMDLGIVRDEQGTQTAGGIPGTPDYYPPELILGLTTRGDKKSDLYCLGLCFYEALTGSLPHGRLGKPSDGGHKGMKNEQLLLLYKRVKEQPPVPFDNPVFLAYPPLRSILERCLAYNRDERMKDCYEFALEIRKLLKVLRGRDASQTTSGIPSVQQSIAQVSATLPMAPALHPQQPSTSWGKKLSFVAEHKRLSFSALATCLLVALISFSRNPQPTSEKDDGNESGAVVQGTSEGASGETVDKPDNARKSESSVEALIIELPPSETLSNLPPEAGSSPRAEAQSSSAPVSVLDSPMNPRSEPTPVSPPISLSGSAPVPKPEPQPSSAPMAPTTPIQGAAMEPVPSPSPTAHAVPDPEPPPRQAPKLAESPSSKEGAAPVPPPVAPVKNAREIALSIKRHDLQPDATCEYYSESQSAWVPIKKDAIRLSPGSHLIRFSKPDHVAVENAHKLENPSEVVEAPALQPTPALLLLRGLQAKHVARAWPEIGNEIQNQRFRDLRCPENIRSYERIKDDYLRWQRTMDPRKLRQ